MSVARPSRFGNPFTITGAADAGWPFPQRAIVDLYRDWLAGTFDGVGDVYLIGQSTYDRTWVRAHLPDLRGRDLACFCDLHSPCHADVLIDLANTESSHV
jgi:hypothetical protein